MPLRGWESLRLDVVRWPLRGTYSSRCSAGARTRSSPGMRNKFPIQQADKLDYQHTFLLSQLDSRYRTGRDCAQTRSNNL